MSVQVHAGRLARTESDSGGTWVEFDRDVLRRAWRLINVVGRPSRVRDARTLTTALLSVQGDGLHCQLYAHGHDARVAVTVPALAGSGPLRCLLVREDLPPESVDRKVHVEDLEPIQRGGFGYILSQVKGETVRIALWNLEGIIPGGKDKRGVRVASGSSRFDFPWEDPDQVDGFCDNFGEDFWEVDARQALIAFESVRHCTRRGRSEEDRFAYRNVAFELARSSGPAQVDLRLVASNGDMIASSILPARVAGGVRPDGLLVPAAGLRTLSLALMALGREGPVELARNSAGGLTLQVPGCTVLVAGGVGRFPPWRDTYPAGRPACISFNVDQAPALARAAEVCARFSGSSGPVSFRPHGDGGLLFFARDLSSSGWGGDAAVRVDCSLEPSLVRGDFSIRALDLHHCLSWMDRGAVDLLVWRPGLPVVLRREGGPEYLIAAWAGEPVQ